MPPRKKGKEFAVNTLAPTPIAKVYDQLCEIAAFQVNCANAVSRDGERNSFPTQERLASPETYEHPLVLGLMVKRRAQLGAGTSLAGLINSRCGSLIRCYGISERPFIASNNFCERFF
jgi:hypothetical protein